MIYFILVFMSAEFMYLASTRQQCLLTYCELHTLESGLITLTMWWMMSSGENYCEKVRYFLLILIPCFDLDVTTEVHSLLLLAVVEPPIRPC